MKPSAPYQETRPYAKWVGFLCAVQMHVLGCACTLFKGRIPALLLSTAILPDLGYHPGRYRVQLLLWCLI